MTPYGPGYTGEVRVSHPHPRSYAADQPLRAVNPTDRFGNPAILPTTEAEAAGYCRVWGITFKGRALCRAIPKPKGGQVCGSPTLRVPGQIDWTTGEVVPG